MKGIGFITGLLTIAVCFTFYGNQLEKTEKGIEGRLQIHNFQVLENNQLLIKDVQELAEQNVAKAFSDAQQVKEIVSQRESANSALDSILAAPNYSFYTNFTLKVAQIHAVNTPGDNHPGAFSDKIRRLTLDKNVNEEAGKFEQQFTKSYAHWRAGQTSTKQAASRPESPESDYYQDLRQSQYDQYVKSGIVQETNISADDLAAQKTVINEAKSEWFHFASPVYDKYGELFEKTLDKTYSVTFKGWINGAVENIFSGIPLVGKLLDPVHDMLKDMIKEKFKKLMSCIRKKDKSAVINELNATDNEINTALNSKTVDLRGWDKLRNQAVSARETLADMGKQIDAANTRTKKLATSNLEEIKSRDRWQSIRERFARKAENAVLADAPPEPFSSEQWRQFKEVLDDWDHYMHTNKEVWWRDGVKNLENEFTTYINQDAMACGAWGFILQQEDWDGAVNFYTSIAPDATATGKPYFLLKYYCATTGNCTIDDLYTREVDNKGVGTFCPH